MRWTLMSVAVTVAAVALAGCGGAADADGSSTASAHVAAGSPTPSVTSTPAVTSSVPTATVAQYASLVAKSRVDMDKTLDQLDGPDCDWSSPGAVDMDPQSIVCGAGLLSMGLEAKTLSLRLTGAAKEGVPAFVGAVPAELTSIVADTVESADALSAAADAANDCTFDTAAGCERKLMDFSSAMSSMRSQLAAWGPYGA